MASSQNNENSAQSKTCRCGEKDTNIWTTTTCENNPDKQSHTCPNCQVFKSGPLFISSKGIGWTSWKKRWFVLTRTSLVFFRSDPNAPPPKGGEGNLTLGGIDLNNSGSVVVRADKKLLTVLFPDGRDGRAFTLKAETSEDLHEWKTALENALMQAPSAALAMGQNGIFRNDMADSIEASVDLWRDKRQVKSLVVGRPILLALEDIDGSPSFLEKALRFIEVYGIKVEGILRQSADVEEVERRVQEYEQGKNEFSPGEDAHVIGDCIKHILRELPSSPVPASSCTALVEAYRTDRGSRVNAMRAAIAETFPEPNRHLVQRILKMMRTVASHKHENRMSLSALAACMAPLLLRPLLAGDCDLEDNFNMGGDGSIQLLQAAAAANHAQAIVIILLEEYEKIFDNDLQDGSLSSDLYSESENGDIDYEESTDNDILEDDGYHDADNDHEADIEDDHECTSSGTTDESCTEVENDLSENEDTEDHNKKFATLKENEVVEAIPTASGTTNAPLLQQDTNWEPSSTATVSLSQHDNVHENDISQHKNCNSLSRESSEPCGDVLASTSTELKSVSHSLASNIANSLEKSNERAPTIRQRTVWGRTSARKNLSMESIDYSSEDEIAIKRLEMTKTELQTKITKEVKGNAILQASLERRKEALHERRLALEQDVDRLQEQLQKERDLRAFLESGLMNLRPGHVYITSSMDGKTRADLEEIALAEADIINLKQRVADLHGQLSHQLQHGYASLCESCSQHLYARQQLAKSCQQNDVASTSALDQNENLSMTLVGLPGATTEQVQAQMRNMHSLLNQELSQEEQTESTSQNVIISSQVNSSSPTAVSTAEAIATTKEFSARDENARLDQHVKTQTQDSPILPDKEPFLRQQIKATSQDSKECLGASSSSHSEETKKVARKATSKRTTSRVENSMMGVDSENKKSQIHDSQFSPKKQLPQNQETSKTSSSSNKSIGSKTVSSIEEPELVGQNAVSKKSSLRGENVKNESEGAANRQPSWKQQPNNASLTSTKSLESSNVSSFEEPATVKRNAASRRSSSREEVLASSSSALTRLTNRLNFLKERRVQLANELQNLDHNRTLASEGPSRAEGPPPRTNSR